MDQDVIHEVAQALKYNTQRPPREVLWAVASLLDAETKADVPKLLQGWYAEEEGSTTWYALGLTKTRVITVSATADRAPWGFGHPRGVAPVPPDSMSAKTRPRAAVSGIEVVTVEGIFGDESLYDWVAGWRIHFDDGKSFDVPADRYEQTRAEIPRALLAELG